MLHNELIEAQIATSFHNELLEIEKNAFSAAPVKAGITAVKEAPAVLRGALKGTRALVESSPTIGKVLRRAARLPHKAYYRTTGRVIGEKGLTKAQKARKLEELGVEGAGNLQKALATQAREIGKVRPGTSQPASRLQRLGIGRKEHEAVRSLRNEYGRLEHAPTERLQQALGRSGRTISAQSEAYRMGLTNVPGYAKSLIRRPGATLKAGWRADTPLGRALTVGFGGMGAYNVATAPKGQRLKTLAEEAPSAALYAFTGPVGWGTQLVGDLAMSSAMRRGREALTKSRPGAAGSLAKAPAKGV